MCLDVEISYDKKPLAVVKCIKMLDYDDKKWKTTYQRSTVPVDNGWFVPKNPAPNGIKLREYDVIYGGYLHAYDQNRYLGGSTVKKDLPKQPRKSFTHYFEAYAFDVVAIGYGALVCRKLYIPAFDKTPKKTALWLKANNIVLPS